LAITLDSALPLGYISTFCKTEYDVDQQLCNRECSAEKHQSHWAFTPATVKNLRKELFSAIL